MKYLISIAFLFLISCNNSEKKFAQAENALDAGREFIDACLKGNFDKANFYVLHTTTNDSLFLIIKNDYIKKSSEEKKQYKAASITILNVEEVSPNETIISYSNSFNKTTRVLKVINNKGSWQVDLQYTIKGNL